MPRSCPQLYHAGSSAAAAQRAMRAMAPFRLRRLAATNLHPHLCHVDVYFGEGISLLRGAMAPDLLGLVGRDLAGSLTGIVRGSLAIQTSGDGGKIDFIEEADPARIAELREVWRREFFVKRGRGSARAARLRAAWQHLWGNRDEKLWARGEPHLDIASAPTATWDPGYASVPAELQGLDTRGSGYFTAFYMLAQVALSDADLILIDRPDRSLHFLIARQLRAALSLAAPSAQVITASYDCLKAPGPGVIPIPTCGGLHPARA